MLPEDNERVRIILGHTFGLGVLSATFTIALLIIFRKVEPSTSYGLDIVLGTLAALAGGYANWAYAQRKEANSGTQTGPD